MLTKKIVGIGYNGMPNGCSDDELPWARHSEDELDTKYPYGKFRPGLHKMSTNACCAGGGGGRSGGRG